ncbi:hypothetical protein H0H87_004863 [Tephrocybe sp. NHM501043]|nr:hypothetical protein H0H87_004863 [Tephrocybe sp. NHM501043]
MTNLMIASIAYAPIPLQETTNEDVLSTHPAHRRALCTQAEPGSAPRGVHAVFRFAGRSVPRRGPLSLWIADSPRFVQDSPGGVDVCLACFNGACAGVHSKIHVEKSGHTFTLNIRRRPKPKSSQRERGDEEPPLKMTKLAIAAPESEEEKYEVSTVVRCWGCVPEGGRELAGDEVRGEPKIKALIEGVLQSLSSARQSEVQAWEEEILPCEHTFALFQEPSPSALTSPLPKTCSSCALDSNLWLCLTCGSLGCGRQQIGGVGGNGHGLRHYEETGHPASVKLGTITPEGGADVYCYVCNDAKLDPEIAAHLATFNINVQQLTKTEKSMTELQIEHNLQYDFALTGEDGRALEPLFGPGLTGLANLGNSCYIASTLQALFALPAFRARYFPHDPTTAHALTCPEPLPASCIECQLRKVADGLLSGRYAVPAPHHDDEDKAFQPGLRPSTLKALVGRGHPEFATMKQQDAEEFLGYLVEVVRRDAFKRSVPDPTTEFSYALEQRLQCTACRGVRYRTDSADVVSVPIDAREKGKDADGKVLYEDVELLRCIETMLGEEELEGYGCPKCARPTTAIKQARFASFPTTLIIHAKKFQLVNWVPTKLDVPVRLPPSDLLTLTEVHLGRGIQPDEVALPEEEQVVSAAPEFDPGALAQLEGMGFPLVRAQKALLATGGKDAEPAMEWLFAHMDDADIDEPIPSPSAGGKAQRPEPPAEQVELIQDMGFTKAQGRKALLETGGDMERAVEWLFSHPDDDGSSAAAPSSSATTEAKVTPGTTDVPARYRLKAFVSHKGPSVHSGHYVAHVRFDEAEAGWVLFNDEKVVRADEESVRELKALAYLWFFERV